METTALEKHLKQVADLFIDRLNAFQENLSYEQPWFNIRTASPINYRGTSYLGSNQLFLMLLLEKEKYKTPVFCTFKQACDAGFNIKKGETAFPVFYKDFHITNKITGEKLNSEIYACLNEEYKKQYNVNTTRRSYSVFNIDQTNMAEKLPRKYNEFIRKYTQNLEEKNYRSEYLSTMLEKQNWDCPIIEVGNLAYYSPLEDKIVLPNKNQFTSNEGFWATLLHEMTHSTMHKERLNREAKPSKVDIDNYAREELVAEIGSALCGIKLGVQRQISQQNLSYLKAWINRAQKDNTFIYKAIVDAAKASNYIQDRLGLKNELTQAITQAKQCKIPNHEKIRENQEQTNPHLEPFYYKITQIGGVALTPKQIEDLARKKTIFLNGLTDKNGEKSNAMVQLKDNFEIQVSKIKPSQKKENTIKISKLNI